MQILAHSYFLGKEKTISKCRLLKLLPSMLSVNELTHDNQEQEL